MPLMLSILHCNSSQLVILLCFALCECEEEGLRCLTSRSLRKILKTPNKERKDSLRAECCEKSRFIRAQSMDLLGADIPGFVLDPTFTFALTFYCLCFSFRGLHDFEDKEDPLTQSTFDHSAVTARSRQTPNRWRGWAACLKAAKYTVIPPVSGLHIEWGDRCLVRCGSNPNFRWLSWKLPHLPFLSFLHKMTEKNYTKTTFRQPISENGLVSTYLLRQSPDGKSFPAESQRYDCSLHRSRPFVHSFANACFVRVARNLHCGCWVARESHV